jgi:amino acid transporter
MPEAGGEYIYLGRGLTPLPGFLFGSLNYFGVRTVGRFQICLTAFKVALLIAIVMLGFIPASISGPQPCIRRNPYPWFDRGPSYGSGAGDGGL